VVVACMIGDLLNDALQKTIHTVGVPEPAARAMLMGHVQVAQRQRTPQPSSPTPA
jgi:hypothetical protein